MEDNYDRLSAVGEAQSRLLGEYWAARNMGFDRVCAGPRVRHIDTAKIVSAAYEVAGLSFPEVQVIPEFDEYPAEAVMERGLLVLLESSQRVRDLHAAYLRSVEPDERRATFQRLFEFTIAAWVGGEMLIPGLETWHEFCSRVNHGLDRFLSNGGRAERVAIFTSAGPMAVALQRALQMTPERALQMSWMPRNSSWSEFLYAAEKFTLSSFNSYGHILAPTHLTYR